MEAQKKRYTTQLANMARMTINRCGLMESPPRLGLGTILGHLGQSFTHMNPRTRLWVQSLGIVWEGVRHPRRLGF